MSFEGREEPGNVCIPEMHNNPLVRSLGRDWKQSSLYVLLILLLMPSCFLTGKAAGGLGEGGWLGDPFGPLPQFSEMTASDSINKKAAEPSMANSSTASGLVRSQPRQHHQGVVPNAQRPVSPAMQNVAEVFQVPSASMLLDALRPGKKRKKKARPHQASATMSAGQRKSWEDMLKP